jgi:hypothetical protein
MARKRDDTVKLVLRLPPALHRRLESAAKRNDQSLNSEMIHRLRQSLQTEERSKALADAVENATRAAAYQFSEAAYQELIRIKHLLAERVDPRDEEDKQ